ncbi:putative RNA-directed DNA polymerase [Helianthus debilis subsp. tardiflorus]
MNFLSINIRGIGVEGKADWVKSMRLVISESQSPFLKGRYILDGPLIVNELLAWLKKKHKDLFLLKIDFEKAYDNVNWGFLVSILDQMGFPDRWILWIKGILASARSAVLVNGSPTFEFNCEKGLRQGDPLSPFLFLIVMEALSRVFDKAIAIGEIEGIKVGKNDLVVSHLFYADDALIMGKWCRENVENTARVLRCFHLCSGLKINIHKSSLIGVGVNDSAVETMTKVLGCRMGMVPFDYLGIKVGANMNREHNWKGVMDVFGDRLSSWKGKVLSSGGRVTLIKSVLESLPVYFFSLYKAPKAVIDKLERIMKRFLWSGNENVNKINWVAWDRVTLPVKNGGLGIHKLMVVNDTLLLKWGWRYRVETCSLWRRMIDECHRSRVVWSALPCNKYISSPWKTIVKLTEAKMVHGKNFNSFITACAGNGRTIQFWCDCWTGQEAFKDKWPAIFSLEKYKRCSVSDRIKQVGGVETMCWNWSRTPNSAEELQQLQELMMTLSSTRLEECRDRWKWDNNAAEGFSVAAIKKTIRVISAVGNYKFFWVSWVPLKCNIFAWRSEFNRIPTRVELDKRGVNIGSLECVLCGEANESVNHLFTGCTMVHQVWHAIANWCNIPPVFVFEVKDCLELFKYFSGDKTRKRIFQGIIIVTLWCIWTSRNDRFFNRKHIKARDIVANVKSKSFFWLKHRSRMKSIIWIDWCKNPMYML